MFAIALELVNVDIASWYASVNPVHIPAHSLGLKMFFNSLAAFVKPFTIIEPLSLIQFLIGVSDHVDIDSLTASIGLINPLNPAVNASNDMSLIVDAILTKGSTILSQGIAVYKSLNALNSFLTPLTTNITASKISSNAAVTKPNTENRALKTNPITAGISLMSAIFRVMYSKSLNGMVSSCGSVLRPSLNLPRDVVKPLPIASVICFINR